MKRTSDLREALAAIVSSGIGAAVAISLVSAHLTSAVRQRPVLHVSSALRVVARAPAAPTPIPVAVSVPIQTKDAPKTHPKPKPAPVPTSPVDTPKAAATEQPVIEDSKSTPMVQPDLPPVAASNNSDLPKLPQAAAQAQAGLDKPPAPPDDYVPPEQQYPEKPGGDTLVLGVLVDSDGNVLDAKILVPSYDALKDLTWATVASKRQHFDVRLPAGQTRWLELRIDMPPNPNSVLP